ncbi:MAG TPA: hypothetical protein VEL28_15345 [Candidatus Binatia bacterium]|nr:hypothetical protein [Candidatus Binatia bacterium]
MHRKAIVALSLLLFASGCAATVSPQKQNGFLPTKKQSGPHDPYFLLGYSQLTRDGLRIAARLDAGTYKFTDVSISIATADAGDPAPLTVNADGKQVLASTSTEKGRYDAKEEEVEFTIGRGGLGKIGRKVVWYRWNIRFDKGGGEPSLVQSPIYRTSRDEAGLPRASSAPGPDTALQLGGPAAKKR